MSNRPEIKKWVSLLAIIGFIIFVIYLFFFTDITKVELIISGISIPIYFLVFLCIVGEALFNSLAWKAVLDNVSVKTTFKRIFCLGRVGAFLDCIIVGGWSGDIFMTYLLGKDEGVDIVKVATSVIIKDILELLVTILSLIIGMLLLVTYYSVNIIVLTAIGITMLFFALPLILIVYLSTNISVTKRLLQFLVKITARIKRKKPSGEFEEKIATQITNFHDVIMIIKKKPKSMIKPMFHQTMAWVCSIAALYLVFIALGSVAGLDKVVITNTIVSTISNQGIALSGFSQIISSGLYQVLGINISLAQASSLLAGFAGFWFVFVTSFVFFQVYGLGTIEEKILNKAYKEKQKRARKDFKQQTDSKQRDFDEKSGTDRSEYEEQRDIREKVFEEKTDNEKKDFEELRDNKEKAYKEQRDIREKDFDNKTDIDRKVFEKLRDNKERDFEEKRDNDRRDFDEKSGTDRSEYKEERDIREKDFEEKTESDKNKHKARRGIRKKVFKEKMNKEKEDFKNNKESEK
jgi:uncharacterized protein (TIRG00374 family)